MSPADSAYLHLDNASTRTLYERLNKQTKSSDVKGQASLARLAWRLGEGVTAMTHLETINEAPVSDNATAIEVMKAVSLLTVVDKMTAWLTYPIASRCTELQGQNDELRYLLGYFQRKQEAELGKNLLDDGRPFGDVSFIPSDMSGFSPYTQLLAGFDTMERGRMGGDYNRALESAAKLRRTIGDHCSALSPMRARFDASLGAVYLDLGDLQKADEQLANAVATLTMAGDVASSDAVNAHHLTGMLHMGSSEYERAYGDFNRAFEVLESIYGENKPETMDELVYLTDARIAQGDHDGAKAILMRILNHGDAARAGAKNMHFLRSVAEVAISNGQTFQAKDAAQSNLAQLRERGDSDPALLRDIHNIVGYTSVLEHKYDEAVASFREQLEIDRRLAHDQFLFLPESGRGAFWSRMEPAFNRLYSANREGTNTIGGRVTMAPSKNKNLSAPLLFDAALLGKGILLESSRGLQKVLAASADPSLSRDFEALTELRRRIASQPYAVKTLQPQADAMERKLALKSHALGDFMNFTAISWQDVRDALKPGEAAVEFIRSADRGIEYYSAELLLHGAEAPEHIFLFALPDGDKTFESPELYVGRKLYTKVWKKLAAKIPEKTRVYFSPAGVLHKTAIEYAMVNDSVRIADMLTPVRVSSTRQLVVRSADKARQHKAAVFGGLNYNLDSDERELYAAAFRQEKPVYRSTPQFDGRRAPWGYLPATLSECEEIASSLSGAGYAIHKVTGDEGVEESFKALDGGDAEMIHIATHGFINSSKRPADNPLVGAYQLADRSLYECGLVMAGANHAWLNPAVVAQEDADDGILTAKEIAELDLSQAGLVVLSACQTADGEVSGEGVFGLQRSLKLAGVGSVVMSLWPVHDEATSLLMREFYRAMLRGESKREALASAQRAVKTAKFDVAGQKLSGSDPRFWASFIILD